MAYNQLNWETQDQYLEIFKEFLENKIASFEFCKILKEEFELSEELSNNTLQSYEIHKKASKFTDFFNDLSISCEVCDRNPEPFRLPGHIDETKLRKEVEENFLNYKNFLKNNSRIIILIILLTIYSSKYFFYISMNK
jgi:hypothetical protein